ncbi:MAG: nodulation protein NfeD, partial [Bacteroidetes bacterium]|nr:nodulation protein NfeD [Bacteroidota bacterium]
IYMANAATMGAATVVSQTGEPVPDKYQSYMRAMMRATAEAKGRDPKIAEAFVDPGIKVPGVVDSGKVLTFTTSEAIANDYCEGEAKNMKHVLELAGITNYELVEYTYSTLDLIIGFLINPMVNSVLLMIIIGGIYFELQTPGVGFPLLAATLAAVLYFAPLYLEGMAEHWEIMIFVVGVILLALEIFVIPGFGVAGVLGGTFVLTGLTLSLIQNVNFDFSFTGFDEAVFALFRVVISIIIPFVLVLIFGKSIIDSHLVQTLVLNETQRSEEGFTSAKYDGSKNMVGSTGIAATPLKPSGKVIVNGDYHDAITEGEWIEKDQAIKIIKTSGYSVIVEKA